MRKAVRTLARICDVPYHRQPLTPQLRHHMAASVAQLVEHNLAKVGVAGSSPVVRSIWAFSSGGERFPDTEEVRSSNLLTPTKCSQLRGYVSGLFCFMPPSAPPNTPPNFEVFDLLECFSMVVREDPQILWVHTRIFHWSMPWAMELGMARPQHVGQALSFGFF